MTIKRSHFFSLKKNKSGDQFWKSISGPILWIVVFVFLVSAVCVPSANAEVSYNGLVLLDEGESTRQAENMPASFEIHFLDVGQGDAALVICDDEAMLIDGGSSAYSSFVYSYLQTRGISRLKYVVATHAHEDHVGGLAAALNFAVAETVFCPVTTYDSPAFQDFRKYLDIQGKTITVPQAGEYFNLGSSFAQILAVNTDPEFPNETSIVLRLDYGDTSFLFTGDAEFSTENAAVSSGYMAQSTLLKIAHHGSSTSTSEYFLSKVNPRYAVISLGIDNTYGCPSENVLAYLQSTDVTLFRTDLHGTIVCCSDGKELSFAVEKNEFDNPYDAVILPSISRSIPTETVPPIETAVPEPVPTPEPEPVVPRGTDYIGNKNTGKFHYPDCKSVKKMKESNKFFYTGTRGEMISMGFDPCGNCHP